ncbi:hypothetical protein HDU79_000745 [Rhizoclosmatium sp. JEL0117]|nr:hypothetical protein HDU79_000745 [Rhizoclosmatium sp. JEL0117]
MKRRLRHEEEKDEGSKSRDSPSASNEPPASLALAIVQNPDAVRRPLWVSEEGRIFLEAFHPLAEKASDFLVSIAEPVSRPARIHEYKLTIYTLYAAVSVGIEADILIETLERYSKYALPQRVIEFVRDCTNTYGKLKLVLKDNRYYLESAFPNVLRHLLSDPIISSSRTLKEERNVIQKGELANRFESDYGIEEPNPETDSDEIKHFEIQKEHVESVKKQCIKLEYPLMEEYDFYNDRINPDLNIDLSPQCQIRDYQEKCLSKLFGGGDGRARSGVIVLPTGAGKTIVGITAACTIKKSVLVLCTNAISVEQWTNEFLKWSSIDTSRISKLTADSRRPFEGDSGILVTTYTMISHSGTRAWDTARMIDFISSREWGLLILDEVHVAPANAFRTVLTTVAAHCKLGLTATLVREDDKIADLNFLIGPKLYEADWQSLTNRGHIARVEVYIHSTTLICH